MLKTLAIIAVIVVVVIAGILIYAATKPDTFTVKRTASIKASAERIYTLIVDLHGWGAWSPYEKKDPDMKRTFSGSAQGKGAVYEWDGNKNVGAGRMEILEAEVPSRVLIKLDFIKPFEGHNTAEFTMLPQGGATNLTWVMSGPAPFMSKVMQVFMSFDRMIGKDFEAGLAKIKSVSEK